MSRLPILKSFLVNSVDPYSDYTKIQSEMDNLFDEFFSSWSSPPTFTTVVGSYPKINVLEKKDCFEIIAATPGLSKEDLSISYKDSVLSIRGESKQEDLSENTKYLCRELKKSNFFRSFRLDDKIIDIEKISSSYVNGELRVSIPKKEKEKEKSFQISIA